MTTIPILITLLTATCVHEQYGVCTAEFPWQQWLRERATMVRYCPLPTCYTVTIYIKLYYCVCGSGARSIKLA
jgi:hypothetical protein